MRQGAADYLKKPIDLDELLLGIDRALEAARLRHQLDYSRSRDSHAVEGALFLGESTVAAPRAIWIGVRYAFGGAKVTGSNAAPDND